MYKMNDQVKQEIKELLEAGVRQDKMERSSRVMDLLLAFMSQPLRINHTFIRRNRN